MFSFFFEFFEFYFLSFMGSAHRYIHFGELILFVLPAFSSKVRAYGSVGFTSFKWKNKHLKSLESGICRSCQWILSPKVLLLGVQKFLDFFYVNDVSLNVRLPRVRIGFERTIGITIVPWVGKTL